MDVMGVSKKRKERMITIFYDLSKQNGIAATNGVVDWASGYMNCVWDK